MVFNGNSGSNFIFGIYVSNKQRKSEMSDEVNKSRKTLVTLFSIGLVPVIIAWTVYNFFPQFLPVTKTNLGTLISPPISHQVAGISIGERKWSLLVPVGTSCDEDCQKRFYFVRQVNIALGKNSDRVQRIIVAESDTALDGVSQQYPDLIRIDSSMAQFRKALEPTVTEPVSGNYIYLMDPNGNIMMFYTLEQAGKPMLKDIKHLLKISNIG
jgi:hypothetical protein